MLCNNFLLIPPYNIKSTKPLVIAKGGSVASNYNYTVRNKDILVKVRFDPTGPTVLLPNLVFLSSTETGELPITDLISKLGKKMAIFENLHSGLM